MKYCNIIGSDYIGPEMNELLSHLKNTIYKLITEEDALIFLLSGSGTFMYYINSFLNEFKYNINPKIIVENPSEMDTMWSNRNKNIIEISDICLFYITDKNESVELLYNPTASYFLNFAQQLNKKTIVIYKEDFLQN